MEYVAGIDEAGRGAVIGPLVIAGVSLPPEKENDLRKMGVKDSKLLSPKRREALAKAIERMAKDVIVIDVGPCKIDNYRKQGVSLNKLEAMKFAEIVNYLKPGRVFIDGPDTNIPRFSGFVRRMLADPAELVVEHHADSRYPVVSAASIVAKVERDRKIAELAEKHGEIGSGYPSDPLTQAWLKRALETSGKFPDIVRKTWMTAESMEGQRLQTRLLGFLGMKREAPPGED
jgi:ribonuclease HII